jgi:hypothetical protein
MPTRTAALALAAVALLGSTGCEKQSPYVTLTAHGVTVKARATNYCRDGKCNRSADKPVLTVRPGDTLGIDVPRSVADQGWRFAGEETFTHDHYRSLDITAANLQGGRTLGLQIERDPKFGAGEWQFTIAVK